MKKRVAVVGAGIFGISTALELAKNPDFHVEVFEKSTDILQAASYVNQGRLHRGYHYPRCLKNAKLFARTIDEFLDSYGKVVFSPKHYIYAISRYDSKTTANQYEKFCKKAGLSLEPITSPLLNKLEIEQAYQVEEQLIDLSLLKEICWQKLNNSNVTVRLNLTAPSNVTELFGEVVYCTYASINTSTSHLDPNPPSFQYQICEKPILRLPSVFANTSLVVFDGPFVAVDPWGRSGNHIMTHVTEAAHQSHFGATPVFDKNLLELCDRGIIINPSITKFPLIIASAARFVPQLANAHHVGSLFIVKILPTSKDKSDYRPTLVRKIGKNVTVVLAGKIVTAVSTAKKIKAQLETVSGRYNELR